MLYGVGGGDLDFGLQSVIRQVELFEKTDDFLDKKINFTAEVNFSSAYQTGESKGTMRGYMTDKGWNLDDSMKELQMYHDPDVLVDFINYSKEKFPADKYILILKDHGYCFDIREQPVDSVVTKTNGNARGVGYDDNNGNNHRPLTIFGIEDAITKSGTKMELIYFDCCLMGQIEMLYQIRNVTNYALTSSNPGWSAVSYSNFLNSLIKYTSIEDAMTEYLLKTLAFWNGTVKAENQYTAFGMDMALTDMSQMEQFADSFIKVKDAFLNSDLLTEKNIAQTSAYFKPSMKQIDEYLKGHNTSIAELIKEDPSWTNWTTGRLYYYDLLPRIENGKFIIDNYTDVDLLNLFSYFSVSYPELLVYTEKMKNSLDKLIVQSVSAYTPDFILQSSLGLMFIDNETFTKNAYELTKDFSEPSNRLGTEKYPTLKSIYTLLDWDKKTKWSEFFERNVTE